MVTLINLEAYNDKSKKTDQRRATCFLFYDVYLGFRIILHLDTLHVNWSITNEYLSHVLVRKGEFLNKLNTF